MQVRNDTDKANSKGGKTIKKIMITLTLLSTLIIVGFMYGTTSFNAGEEKALSLEEAYMAQYPTEMPDVLFDPIPAHIPF